MPLTVKIFGELKESINKDTKPGLSIRKELDNTEITNILDILDKLGFDKDNISHIFVNGVYSALTKPVKDGDIVSLFPKNMGLLYKWYFNKDTGE
ncbi:MAG: hypothetical protein GF317_14820 [Candidatus Lokiarchaeota archaeon]|nr:hypothetical protein [Candidatus Lokiarchaeota archaeon]MBD3200875.1 hypothetical protein [Candidatus Lokiarchaeota archaeon]